MPTGKPQAALLTWEKCGCSSASPSSLRTYPRTAAAALCGRRIAATPKVLRSALNRSQAGLQEGVSHEWQRPGKTEPTAFRFLFVLRIARGNDSRPQPARIPGRCGSTRGRRLVWRLGGRGNSRANARYAHARRGAPPRQARARLADRPAPRDDELAVLRGPEVTGRRGPGGRPHRQGTRATGNPGRFRTRTTAAFPRGQRG